MSSLIQDTGDGLIVKVEIGVSVKRYKLKYFGFFLKIELIVIYS